MLSYTPASVGVFYDKIFHGYKVYHDTMLTAYKQHLSAYKHNENPCIYRVSGRVEATYKLPISCLYAVNKLAIQHF